MANCKIFLILLRPAIFTGIVPYIVGLWLDAAASQRFTSRAPYCFARFSLFFIWCSLQRASNCSSFCMKRKIFGEQYLEYCRCVPSRIPRLRFAQ
jgi:hypothetical protein